MTSDFLPSSLPASFPGLDSLLGFVCEQAGPDRVVLRWPVRPDLHQPFGLLHGGVHCAAVESAASMGAAAWWGDRGQVVGVANQTDFYRAVRDGELTATATPLHQGRSQQVWQVVVTDGEQRVVARGQVRLQNLTSPGNGAPSAPAQ